MIIITEKTDPFSQDVVESICPHLTPRDVISWMRASKKDKERIDQLCLEQFDKAKNSPFLAILNEGFRRENGQRASLYAWLALIGFKPTIIQKLTPFLLIQGNQGPSTPAQAQLKTAYTVGKWLQISGFTGGNVFAQFLTSFIQDGIVRANHSLYVYLKNIIQRSPLPHERVSHRSLQASFEQRQVQESPYLNIDLSLFRQALEEIPDEENPKGILSFQLIPIRSLPGEVLYADPKVCDLRQSCVTDITLVGAFENLEELRLNDKLASNFPEKEIRSKLNPKVRDTVKIVIEKPVEPVEMKKSVPSKEALKWAAKLDWKQTKSRFENLLLPMEVVLIQLISIQDLSFMQNIRNDLMSFLTMMNDLNLMYSDIEARELGHVEIPESAKQSFNLKLDEICVHMGLLVEKATPYKKKQRASETTESPNPTPADRGEDSQSVASQSAPSSVSLSSQSSNDSELTSSSVSSVSVSSPSSNVSESTSSSVSSVFMLSQSPDDSESTSSTVSSVPLPSQSSDDSSFTGNRVNATPAQSFTSSSSSLSVRSGQGNTSPLDDFKKQSSAK